MGFTGVYDGCPAIGGEGGVRNSFNHDTFAFTQVGIWAPYNYDDGYIHLLIEMHPLRREMCIQEHLQLFAYSWSL